MTIYKKFYDFLLKNKLITNVWGYILELIEKEIITNSNKEYYLIIFSIYFSLINDGNITISLDKETLKNKWLSKIKDNKILLLDNEDFDEALYDNYLKLALNTIDGYLDKINLYELPELIGANKFFQIDNGYLYLKKYNEARLGIIENIDKLFKVTRTVKSFISSIEIVDSNKIKLSNGQNKAFIEGLSKNLIITGGPGTGKTTSILFLLINLLKNNPDDLKVYLVAPSGKAASRMKESIINGLLNIKEEFIENNKEIIDKINNLQESTIHRLLEVDYETNGFLYNKNHQFLEKSVFIIDEASMIDICLFNALLEAIPQNAFIYIMGDKNQLPSVECGSVFGDLLVKESLKDNIIELDESIRFEKDTKIYELADIINNDKELNLKEEDWQDYESFEIKPIDNTKSVYFYNIEKDNVKSKDIIESVVEKWGSQYYSNLKNLATNLDDKNLKQLESLFELTENAKILCAENKGPRGIIEINKFISKKFIDQKTNVSFNGCYPGMIMMINRNNKLLDLYNGDSGILVTFENDDTLYFMVKKSSILVKEDGKLNDKIFKIKKYIFYPLRLISRNEIDLAYAITIHKSQGSDYKNILVILPNVKGHPLLNRQIIYTAITRTKGNTYILSSNERLIEAKKRLIKRDTNIK